MPPDCTLETVSTFDASLGPAPARCPACTGSMCRSALSLAVCSVRGRGRGRLETVISRAVVAAQGPPTARCALLVERYATAYSERACGALRLRYSPNTVVPLHRSLAPGCALFDQVSAVRRACISPMAWRADDTDVKDPPWDQRAVGLSGQW